jgi:hypothetical protein
MSCKVIFLPIVLLLSITLKAQLFGSLAADDYDAARFCSSSYAAITNPVQRDANNILTKDLKVYALWNLDQAIYPLVGGNSNSHSFNLKNPSVYQMTWIGSPSHDSYGVDFLSLGQDQNYPISIMNPSNNSMYFVGSRTSSSDISFFRNGTLFLSSSLPVLINLPNYSFGIAWCNPQNTWPEYSTKQCAFASIGAGFSARQVNLKTVVVNRYESKLGRNIF